MIVAKGYGFDTILYFLENSWNDFLLGGTKRVNPRVLELEYTMVRKL